MFDKEQFTKNYKRISRTIGYDCSAIYGLMEDTYDYAKRHGLLTKDGFFFLTVPTVEKELLMKRRGQEFAIKKLIDGGYVKMRYSGMPKKRFFQLVQNVPTSEYKTYQQVGTKRTNKSVQNERIVGTKRTNKSVQNVPTCTSKTYHNKEQIQRLDIQDTDIQDTDIKMGVAEIFKLIQNYSQISPLLKERVEDDVSNYGVEWCKEAFEIGKARGITNWNYAQGILKRWGASYGKDERPWEQERRVHDSSGIAKRKQTDGSNVDWDNEPDEFVW